MNKKYAVFGLAGALAIIGVLYFGVGANQQASVANIFSKLTGPVIPIDEPTIPTPIMTEFQWRKLCRDGKPHIQVLSPNGGEIYQAEQQITVKWRSCNYTGSPITGANTVNIILGYQNGTNGSAHTLLFNSTGSTPNDGTETLSLIPDIFTNSSMSFGTFYKVFITNGGSPNDPGPVDGSDNVFTINQPVKVSVHSFPTPTSATLLASQTANTNNIILLKFKVKATGADLNIKTVPIQIKATKNVSNIISSLKITKPNGTILAVAEMPGKKISSSGVIIRESGCTLSCGFIFNLTNPLPWIGNGAEYQFNIVADIKPMTSSSTSYTTGDTIKASIVNNDVMLPNNFSIMNQNGDNVLEGAPFRTGSATGTIYTFGLGGNTTTDMCPNISGVQTSIPSGMIKDSSGNCVAGGTTVSTWEAFCADGQPHIQVLSPDGGETYQAGAYVPVTWRSCNPPLNSTVMFALDQTGTGNYGLNLQNPILAPGANVGNVTANDGQDVMILPTPGSSGYYPNFYTGSNFKVHIYLIPFVNGVLVDDTSNNFFTITN